MRTGAEFAEHGLISRTKDAVASVCFVLFEWLSSFRLPLESRKDFKSSECEGEWRPGIVATSVLPRPLPFQPQSDQLSLLALSLGRHRSLPLHPGSCVFGGRCHVSMAINLGQRHPVTGTNTHFRNEIGCDLK